MPNPTTISVKDATAAAVTVSTLDAVLAVLPAALVGGRLAVDGPLTDAQLRAAGVPVKTPAVPATTGMTAVGSAGAAATLAHAAAGAGVANVIGQVVWSYSAAPTGGRLTIENGSGAVVLDIDITAAGPGEIVFDPPLKGSANTALVLTLAGGGGSVVGKLSTPSKRTE